MFKLAALLLLTAVCANAQTPAELEEIKRLQDALDALQNQAKRQVRQANLNLEEGALTFKLQGGKRIGYQIGDNDEVDFDDLVKTDSEIGLLLQTVHQGGISTGQTEGSLEFIRQNMSVEAITKKLKPLEDSLDDVTEDVRELAQAQTKSDLSIAILELALKKAEEDSGMFWYDTFVYVGEESGRTSVPPNSIVNLNIVGVGFESLYHPSASGQFTCKFKLGSNEVKSSASIVGTTEAGETHVHLECPLPKSYSSGAEITVSVWSHDGTEMPFKGPDNSNKFKVEPVYFKTEMKSNYPNAPSYTVKGSFTIGTRYKCRFQGDNSNFDRTVQATDFSWINCGAGPTSTISSDFADGWGTADLVIMIGNTPMHGTSGGKHIKYYVCASTAGSVRDCLTGCAKSDATGGQAKFQEPGVYQWKAPFCGAVSVVAIGAGSGGGQQWSSGGGGGGGLGWIKSYDVVKGQSYKVEVGKGGPCVSNAGNTDSSDGGNSYFVSLNVVAGYGGGKGGPNAQSGSPGYGGGYKGNGGGRGGYGGRGSWTGGGGGAGGYNGRGGNAQGCHHNNRNCDAPSGSGGGGGGGYYSSSYGTPAGGGVGLYGKGGDGRGDWQQGSTGGSDGEAGKGGEGGGAGSSSRCTIHGGANGGGGGGSGSHWNSGGGKGGNGAVRIVWGPNRQYPDKVRDV